MLLEDSLGQMTKQNLGVLATVKAQEEKDCTGCCTEDRRGPDEVRDQSSTLSEHTYSASAKERTKGLRSTPKTEVAFDMNLKKTRRKGDCIRQECKETSVLRHSLGSLYFCEPHFVFPFHRRVGIMFVVASGASLTLHYHDKRIRIILFHV